MNLGDVLCLKTTGELVVVIATNATNQTLNKGEVGVRRPVMTTDDGIKQTLGTFNDFELESIEEHLRREAKEMLLKMKIQEEIREEMEKDQKKSAISLVN